MRLREKPYDVICSVSTSRRPSLVLNTTQTIAEARTEREHVKEFPHNTENTGIYFRMKWDWNETSQIRIKVNLNWSNWTFILHFDMIIVFIIFLSITVKKDEFLSVYWDLVHNWLLATVLDFNKVVESFTLQQLTLLLWRLLMAVQWRVQTFNLLCDQWSVCALMKCYAMQHQAHI